MDTNCARRDEGDAHAQHDRACAQRQSVCAREREVIRYADLARDAAREGNIAEINSRGYDRAADSVRVPNCVSVSAGPALVEGAEGLVGHGSDVLQV